MAEANERIITDDTGKEILAALRNIPGVTGATTIDHGGTGATTAEEALRNLGAQPKINVENVEEELGKMVKSVNSMTPDASGNVNIVHVRTAENLTSDDAQDIYGEFIERTTGGTTSLSDGKSWIGIMEGNSIRTGYTPEDKSVSVNNMPRTPITASIDWSYFIENIAESESMTTSISHNGSVWNVSPAAYGITIEGYPISGDRITVRYVEKVETYNVLSEGGITITVDWPTYETAVAETLVDSFSYSSGSWNYDLADYGITVNGTPMDGDVIEITYSPEVRSLYVDPATRGDAINAYVNWDTFKMAVSDTATNVTLTYATDWSEPLADYGVSISGTPIRGDQIALYFTPEVRGNIANSTPTRFVSTGWNLYDHQFGYARVLKYSDVYGFIISGTYSSITFSETANDVASPVAVDSDGHFSIPSDGYIHVIGGNDVDTAIYMTWSDWTNGTPLEWAEYSESVIDLASLMQTTFPFGLCSVGSSCDDIDFSNKIATSRINRVAYNDTNLALAKNSGREYAYDQNYIYIVRETPVSVGFSLDYELDAFDHGLERVEGTTVPVFIHMLYGHNLRDKLRTDVVTISQQNLTSAQKQQIRENLGLGGSAELPIENGGTGANDAAGARTNLGLGSASQKNVTADIASGDLNLPTSNAVYSKIGNVTGNDLQTQVTALNDSFTNFAYTLMKSNDNLNDYNERGFYGSPNSSVSGSMQNTPITSTGFVLVVMRYGAFRIQVVIGMGGAIYVRRFAAGEIGWQKWFKYTGTEVT